MTISEAAARTERSPLGSERRVTVRRTGNVLHAITVGLPTLWLISLPTH